VQAWVTEWNAAELMGGVPDGVELVVWDARSPAPDDRTDVAVFVPPTWNKAACLNVLPTLRSLRAIQLLSAGADWILPHVPPSVALCDARGAHDVAVAEWVMTAILTSLRGFDTFVRQQGQRVWQPAETDTLYGKRVLVVGYGSIGAALERRLEVFGGDVRRVARRPRPGVHAVGTLLELLPDTDVLVLLLPLTPQTRGLVDADMLSRLPDGALVVNASRGAVVDTAALAVELERKRLRAVLDVVEPEPLPAEHALWTLPGVIVTPHVASLTPTWLPGVYRLLRRQLLHLLDGTPFENQVVEGY
jgi:phosphoglycerate dehydrogenase-like enzyme